VKNQLNKWRRKNKQALTDVDDLLAEGRSLKSAVFVASVEAAWRGAINGSELCRCG